MEAHQESLKIFHKTISHELLKEKPLLIIANKQDLSGEFHCHGLVFDVLMNLRSQVPSVQKIWKKFST
jgi:hypothetical protein